MPFVVETIDSVLAQSYGNIEYVVVDGGSIDGTVKAIEDRQARITRWISKKDRGIADAFNKGLELSSGEYLLFLNADDTLTTTSIVAEMADEIIKQQFPCIVYGDCAYVDRDSGELIRRLRIELSRSALLLGKMPPHPCMFVSRQYFEKYGAFDLSFKIAMDFEWLLRGAMTERIIHVPHIVTNMRSGGASTLNRDFVVEEIISALRKNGYLSTDLCTTIVRAYFFARLLTKRLLQQLGLHKLINQLKR